MLHDEAHVWLLNPYAVNDADTLQHCNNILESHEREKVGRFFRASDGHHYLISHALVRSVLSRYVDTAPGNWRFRQGPHGRPEIISEELPGLRFNLTHTDGLAACIVTLDDDCGIDAEKLQERTNPLGVAKRMFSELELDRLKQLEGKAFLEYFYAHWTLREAYVKALGIGISFPTRKLEFSVKSDDVTMKFDGTPDDQNDDWQFRLIRHNATHIVAIALRGNTGINKKICVHQFGFND
ncbi:hypothetical protein MNBD_GAMMA15-2212 [hydrothermal vent metagenome]|uniref:Uncharacterized protein n=1 Tax=hydrothermal vent metagenome TaxID=652676 RepID=A0A3B0YYU0_9ZZZZ